MKDLKKTFTQQFVISSAASTAVLSFMTVPFLEAARTQLATTLGTSPNFLWAPAALLIIGLQYFTYQRSLKQVAKPFHHLLRAAEHGEQGFAFKTRAKSKEEDGIKHAIEAANLRARDSQDQAEELEAELEKTKEQLSQAQQKAKIHLSKYEELDASTKEIRVANETLKAANTALELTLENERKLKIGIEVEKRTDEIYTQMEHAISAAAIKAVWIPSLVHELKTPISIINEASGKLAGNWQERSLKEVNQEIETILSQSETQLKLLNEILDRQPPQKRPEPPALELETAIEPLGTEEETPQPSREPESILEITQGIEIEEPDPEHEPLALGLEPKTESNPAPAASPQALESILGNLVDTFSKQYADIHYSFALDKDLEIELEDPTMLTLLHTLAESASHCTLEGEIVFGVELQTDSITFDIVCNGELDQNVDPVLLSRADRAAQSLGGQIEIEPTTPTELHLSFTYPLGTPETVSEAKQAIELD